MKGMIFAGCSYTFGHGLWYYSELENIPYGDDFLSVLQTKTAYVKNMEAIRFPRLVARHFKKFEVVRKSTSGSEENSIDFLKLLFSDRPQHEEPHVTNDRLKYDEIEYIIFQTSYADRNTLIVNVDGEELHLRMRMDNEYFIFKTLEKIGIDTYDKFNEFMANQLFIKLKTELEFYESKGIKCRILSITNDYIENIKEDNWMLERYIPIKYNDKIYDSVNEMCSENLFLLIKNDHETFGDETPNDLHPSKLCHEIIANSIIDKLESEKTK